MRSNIFKIVLLMAAGLFVLSCVDDNMTSNGPSYYDLELTLAYPNDVEYDQVETLTIKLTNIDRSDVSYELPARGLTSTTLNVLAGTYQVTASGKYTATIILNGSANVSVYQDLRSTVELVIARESPLVIKELYSSGYDWYFRDSYFVIYNNSDEVQYLDRVIFGVMMGLTSESVWLDGDGNLMDRYPLYGNVVAFPGTGTTYPLQPGESVLVANDAVDHSVLNDPQNPDLSGADWEIYIPFLEGWMGDTDYDAPNLDVIYRMSNTINYFNMTTGAMGFVMARLPDDIDPHEWVKDSDNFSPLPTNPGSDQRYLLMPSKYVWDAIEIFDGDETDHYKNLRPEDDMGSTFNYPYSGYAIRRKVERIEDGRVYYKDTNNSTEDFLYNQPLTFKENPSTVDE